MNPKDVENLNSSLRLIILSKNNCTLFRCTDAILYFTNSAVQHYYWAMHSANDARTGERAPPLHLPPDAPAPCRTVRPYESRRDRVSIVTRAATRSPTSPDWTHHPLERTPAERYRVPGSITDGRGGASSPDIARAVVYYLRLLPTSSSWSYNGPR